MLEATTPKRRLGELSSVITKGTTPTTYGYRYTSRGIPFFRIENITKAGQIDLYGSGILYVDEDAHSFMQRSQLKEGDLVVSIAGTIGRIAVVLPEHVPGNCNQAVAITVKPASIFGGWCCFFATGVTLSRCGPLLLIRRHL